MARKRAEAECIDRKGKALGTKAEPDFNQFKQHHALDDDGDVCDECPRCGGEGYIEDDCFEDTCCCADPASSHGIVKCPTCQGTG